MAVARMAKCLIVIHRSQAHRLLDALQDAGICHLLNAREAQVSRLLGGQRLAERPRAIEQIVARLEHAIAYLSPLAPPSAKGLAAVVAPRMVCDRQQYLSIVADQTFLQILDQVEQLQHQAEKAKAQMDSAQSAISTLQPWVGLDCPVEDLRNLSRVSCWTGLVGSGQIDPLMQRLGKVDAVLQTIGSSGGRVACLVIATKHNAEKVQSILRSVDFEPVSFESATGTVGQLLDQAFETLNSARAQLDDSSKKAQELAQHVPRLQIILDHYTNLIRREQAQADAPATMCTILLEGWVKQRDLDCLAKIVSEFEAATLTRLQPDPDEQVPVDIENPAVVRPFEVITRLYGMPRYLEVDPTALLAPFFALFFGICLGDAGYGLVLIAVMLLFIKKAQADKRFLWLLWACGILTAVVGALTGSWFGDAIQQFAPALEPVRQKMMWFDPFQKPMQLFLISIALGYIQIMTGLFTALIWNIKQRNLVAAVFDQLAWIGLINSVVILAFSRSGVLPAGLQAAGLVAIGCAIALVVGSHREGGWGARIGMGLYNVFSSIFYIGDLLSYLRLMGLCMVSAGLAMAINLMAGIAKDIPFGIGVVASLAVFVGGHIFNLVMSALGAFVHTLRLQYVEFFPKFFVGGGKAFEPLAKQYRYVYIKDR